MSKLSDPMNWVVEREAGLLNSVVIGDWEG